MFLSIGNIFLAMIDWSSKSTRYVGNALSTNCTSTFECNFFFFVIVDLLYLKFYFDFLNEKFPCDCVIALCQHSLFVLLHYVFLLLILLQFLISLKVTSHRIGIFSMICKLLIVFSICHTHILWFYQSKASESSKSSRINNFNILGVTTNTKVKG